MAKQSGAAAPAVVAQNNNRMKVILIALTALLIAVGLSVVATWYVLSRGAGEAESSAASSPQTTKALAIYETLEPAFVVNFKSQGKPRYLQVSVALLARNQAELDRLKVHMPTLRNQLVMLFSEQDFDELNTALGVDILKQKATAAVQQLALIEVGSTVVEQVLFTNVVMQ